MFLSPAPARLFLNFILSGAGSQWSDFIASAGQHRNRLRSLDKQLCVESSAFSGGNQRIADEAGNRSSQALTT